MYSKKEHGQVVALDIQALDLHDAIMAVAGRSTSKIGPHLYEAANTLDNWMHDELNPVLKMLDDMEADTHTKEYAREREQARRNE